MGTDSRDGLESKCYGVVMEIAIATAAPSLAIWGTQQLTLNLKNQNIRKTPNTQSNPMFDSLGVVQGLAKLDDKNKNSNRTTAQLQH